MPKGSQEYMYRKYSVSQYCDSLFRDAPTWHIQRAGCWSETLRCGLLRDGVQFCSGLVDLVVCVGRHGGGGHCLAFAGERFVGLVAEDIAEVSDRGIEFGDRQCGEGAERETSDGGRRLVAPKPVEQSRNGSQRVFDVRGITGVMRVADRQSEVIERG